MALAEQFEHADALPEVVIRLGRAGRPDEPATQPEKFSPGAAHGRRADAPGDRIEPPLRPLRRVRGEQRFDGDELRLQAT